MDVYHIRITGRMRTDRRYRMGGMRVRSNHAPTACGAAASPNDIDRKGLAHFVKHADIKPDWLASVCAECRRVIDEKIKP